MLDPGATHSKTFKVRNRGSEDINFTVEVMPYQVANKSYAPNFSIRNEYTQIVDWITLSATEGRIAPGETFEVTFTINVPENAVGGGQYAMIAITPDKGIENSVVNAVQRVGYIVSSEISGETKIAGSLLDKNITSFLFEPPISATYSAKNDGNVSNTISAVMRVTNYFTGSEAYSNANEPLTNEILPGTERDMSISWPGSPYIGIFKVALTLNYLEEVSTISKTVFLCPMWFIIIVSLLLVIIIGYIVAKVKKRSRSHTKAANF